MGCFKQDPELSVWNGAWHRCVCMLCFLISGKDCSNIASENQPGLLSSAGNMDTERLVVCLRIN